MRARSLVLIVLTLLAAPLAARKPKPPAPPPKPMRIGVFYDARSIASFGERGLEHVGPLLVERQKILFANSGIDPVRYRFELVYSGALPSDFVVEDPCDLGALLTRAARDPRVLGVLKQHEIAVPFFLFQCRDIHGYAGVTPIAPRTAKDYTRNVLIGFAALETSAVYNPDTDSLWPSNVAAHEFGHAAGGNHPVEQSATDTPVPGRSDFPWARGFFIPQGPEEEAPHCDVMGILTCAREPWYSNTAFPGRGTPQADVARAIVLNWDRLADVPKVRERLLY